MSVVRDNVAPPLARRRFRRAQAGLSQIAPKPWSPPAHARSSVITLKCESASGRKRLLGASLAPLPRSCREDLWGILYQFSN